MQKVKYKKRINKEVGRKIEEKVKGICHRQVGGNVVLMTENEWIDPTMVDWPDDDYRIFAGNLGNEVKDEDLGMAFKKYPSFLKAKVDIEIDTGSERQEVGKEQRFRLCVIEQP